MAGNINPDEHSAAESDYKKKFDRLATPEKAQDIKAQEKSPDVSWKTITAKKASGADDKKGKFRFAGRRAGTIRNGSAFAFIIGMILLGVMYTSIFAPNIILVNLKEMYTNDLSDSTIALDAYYKKMLNYKIGHAQCSDTKSIKCKLSTMSRAQKKAFEKYGFTVVGTKVDQNDGRDTGNGDNNSKPESRYQVSAIIPPTDAKPVPLVTGDMVWAYAQLSTANKALVYGVFNPKSSFYMDSRFVQRLKDKYDLTKSPTVSGTTEQQVNQSFDSSMTGGDEGIDIAGRPKKSGGIGLGSLRNPVIAAQLEAAMLPVAAEANSFVGIQCAWYSIGKATTNDAKSAKAHTIARFAMQYLKAADEIKAGTSDDIAINTLSSNLAQSTGGGYNGPNATDSSMYKSIVYGSLPIPSPFGILYYLDTFDVIAAMMPSWTQVMASAAAEGTASNVSGSLLMPPANLLGSDRDYCLGGETTQNHTPIKEAECSEAITASAPPGWQGALTPILELGRKTCPHPHYDQTDNTEEGQFIMQPTVKATSAMLSPYVSFLFSANAIAWANVMYPFFTSQTKGVAASDAIFAGTGEILGDMAMSRGMEPANVATLGIYLGQKPAVDKDLNEVAQYNARKAPFDIYNRFSFLGSIVHGLSPTYNSQTPLFSSLANSFSLIGSSLKQLNQSASAMYYLQPDGFNPARLTCVDPEYLAIGIMADTACNVRYTMGPTELAAQIDSVLNYMTQSHSDLTKDNIQELTQRQAQADSLPDTPNDSLNVARMLKDATDASTKPEIDKETGKPIANSEYSKYLEYCVNRQDPWGRSAVAVTYNNIPDNVKTDRMAHDTSDFRAATSKGGDPYEQTPGVPYISIMEGAKADQDWYTGKKCLDQSEELSNFRAYTMACSVDGSFSGGIDCTDADNSAAAGYSDNFYTGNDILYSSWY